MDEIDGVMGFVVGGSCPVRRGAMAIGAYTGVGGTFNKMEPTNPNANTFEKLICPNDTLVGHSCRTLLWDTLVGHSCRTLLSETLVGHSCGTLL